MPSGVSYVLENREVLKRIFPACSKASRCGPVNGYPSHLLEMLESLAPAPQRPAARGGAHPRHLQLGLLRAQLPGPADGRGTGGRPRPGGGRRRRLHAHHPRPGARGRDLPPRRRRFPRPPGLPRRFHARRPRPDGRLSRRPRRARQRPRQRRGRRQGDLRLRARHDPLLRRRGAHPPQRAHLPLLARCGPQVRAGEPGKAGGQGRQRKRRLRHAGGPALHRGAARGIRRPHHRPTRATTSPSPPWRSPACPPSSTTISKAATSICAPTCSAARTSTCSPAASPASPCARARWWSTPRRAAAAKTPGCSKRPCTRASTAGGQQQ